MGATVASAMRLHILFSALQYIDNLMQSSDALCKLSSVSR